MTLEFASTTWEEIKLPKQHLWKAMPSIFRCRERPVYAHPNHGSPRIMEHVHGTLRPRPSDVNIVTYPKAGTSWIQEIVWLINNNADVEQANEEMTNNRTLYVELERNDGDVQKNMEFLETKGPPRHLKWHHAPWLLPCDVLTKAKIVYQYRNPKDTAVSWYHFQRSNKCYGFTGNFDEFLELFMRNEVPYGSYWENLNTWWLLRNEDNVLITVYEEMHCDIEAQIYKLAKFLDKSLNEDQVQIIIRHTTFEAMRSNPMTSGEKIPTFSGETPFMRKGKVGDWKNYFSEKQNQEFDDWIRCNNKHSIPFFYELFQTNLVTS